MYRPLGSHSFLSSKWSEGLGVWLCEYCGRAASWWSRSHTALGIAQRYLCAQNLQISELYTRKKMVFPCSMVLFVHLFPKVETLVRHYLQSNHMHHFQKYIESYINCILNMLNHKYIYIICSPYVIARKAFFIILSTLKWQWWTRPKINENNSLIYFFTNLRSHISIDAA
jgi:hypothetical protein